MNSLQLSTNWDLTVDAANNIAVVAGPAAIEQNVASAVKLFLGELYWDTTKGVPYLTQVFDAAYNPSLIVALLQQAALTVPGVVKAQAFIDSHVSGRVSGRIEVIDLTGASLGVTF